MFEDPAYPSMPPGPDDDSVRPMSIVGAALWSWGAQIGFLCVLWIMMSLNESAGYDLVGRALCQVVGYSLALYLVLRVHGPESRIRDFLALRPSHFAFYPLAIVLGVSATLPMDWMYERIRSLFPAEGDAILWIDLFYQMPMAQRLAVAASAVVLGPLVEEALFRGALWRPLRKEHTPVAVVVTTAVFFALVHLDAERLFPVTLLGLALGHLRWASGSLVPPLLVHMAFNAVPLIHHLGRQEPPPPGEPVDWRLMVACIVAGLACLAAIHALGRRVRRADG
jgi:membrane protease YdiL (CAAX protease family)